MPLRVLPQGCSAGTCCGVYLLASMTDISTRPHRGVSALLAAMALVTAACSQGTSTSEGTTTTTTTTTVPASAGVVACLDTTPDPVPLQDNSGATSVVDVVARPSGQVIAVGSSVWIRDPDASTWRTAAAPGGAEQRPVAVVEGDGDVWVVTADASAEGGGPTRLHRSSDLTTWTEVPFLLDGQTTSATINAAARDGDRWLGLAQDGDSIDLISSSDGQRWETAGSVASPDDEGNAFALFDLEVVDDDPTGVGFTVGNAIRPLLVGWPADGSVTEVIIEDGDLLGVRPWGLAPRSGGRLLLAVDRLEYSSGTQLTGFTAALIERTNGKLDLLTNLSSPEPYAVPADLVAIGDEVIVVGSTGPAREQLAPVVWTVCLMPS